MTKLEWQYNGVDEWKVIVAWCKEEIPGQWATKYIGAGYTIYFANKEAFSYFLLRWL